MSNEPAVHDHLNAELLQLIRQQTEAGQTEIDVMGKTFTILPEVFNVATLLSLAECSTHSPLKIVSDELAARGPEATLEILEIGPGMGHFVVCAAGLGPNIQVTAVDINPAAVDNVTLNVDRHGLQERVTCSVGDVYNAPVTAGKTFDVIYWNPPFSRGDDALRAHTQLERSVWDPGYDGLTQYVSRAREFLKPGGRLLMGWSHFYGDGEFLAALATQHGWHLQKYGEVHFAFGTSYQTFLSYELISSERAPTCPTCHQVMVGRQPIVDRPSAETDPEV